MGRNRIAWRRQPQDQNRIAFAWPKPPDGGDINLTGVDTPGCMMPPHPRLKNTGGLAVTITRR